VPIRTPYRIECNIFVDFSDCDPHNGTGWPTPAPLFADWNAVPGFEPSGATGVSMVVFGKFSTPNMTWCWNVCHIKANEKSC